MSARTRRICARGARRCVRCRGRSGRGWRSGVVLLMGAAAVIAGRGLSVVPAGAAAAGWSEPMAMPGSTGAGFPYAVAIGRDGLAVVAFQRHSMRVTVREHGRWTAVARPVSSGRGGTGAPAVAVTSTGEIVVAWMRRHAHRSRAVAWAVLHPRRCARSPRPVGPGTVARHLAPRARAANHDRRESPRRCDGRLARDHA